MRIVFSEMDVTFTGQTPELLFPCFGWFTMPDRNVQKSKARPIRSIDNPGDDHDLGLWIDYELLRKHHQNRTPQTILHDPLSSVNNRYLELADLALGNGKVKKKAKGAASGA